MIIMQSYEKLTEKIKKGRKLLFIDVRSPSEYREARIPGAINIPVFSDKEREYIGTLYKVEGKRTAIREAVGIVGEKIQDIYIEFEKHYERDMEIIVYCARGGMRSSTVVSLFKEFSLPVIKLENGYKGYRQFLNDNLPKMLKEKEFVVLYGKTGSGKTNILKEIEQKGYDVLDLEKCANHRGSLLGGIGLGGDTTQKNFEARVLDSILKSQSDVIFTEGESKRIGSVIMPNYLFEVIFGARKFFIETDMDKRIKIISEEYLKESYDENEIFEALEKLARYIGEKKKNEYVEKLKNKQFDEVIRDLMENYYDKVYKTKSHTFEKTFDNVDEEKCAEDIIKYVFGI